MSDNKSKGRGLTRVVDLLPGLEPLAPMVRAVEQSNAATIQGKHHYNRYKQIDALADIGEDPNSDMGFMTRLLTLCARCRAPIPAIERNTSVRTALIACICRQDPKPNFHMATSPVFFSHGYAQKPSKPKNVS
jgi:hypothetical protein